MFGFAYYSLARYYAFATARALDSSVVARRHMDRGARGCLLLLRFDLPTREEAALARLAALLQARCAHAPSAEWVSGRQRGLWRLLENTLVLCWLQQEGDEVKWQAIRAEAAAVAAALPEILVGHPFAEVLPHAALTLHRAEGELGTHAQDWRALLGTALQQPQGGQR